MSEKQAKSRLIINNAQNSVCLKYNEQTYRQIKSLINSDTSIFIDTPFDCNEEFRLSTNKLNVLRSSNQSNQQPKLIYLQKKCVFLWIKYWCLKIIDQRNSIPLFIKDEPVFETYFEDIFNEYINTNMHSIDQIFDEFKYRINAISFSGKDTFKYRTVVLGYVRINFENTRTPIDIIELCAHYYAATDVHILKGRRQNVGKFHRIYFLPLPEYTNKQIYVKLPEICNQKYKMCKVFAQHIQNNRLLYLDVCIPWETLTLPNTLTVSFCSTNNLEITKSHLKAQNRGMFQSIGNSKEAETTIVNHLSHDIIDWPTYRYSRLVLNSLKVLPEQYSFMWKQQLQSIQNEPNLKNVHKLQLLKSINPSQLPDMAAKDIFFITRACVQNNTALLNGKNKINKTEIDYNQSTIGIAIHNSFVGDLRRILNYVPSHLISTSDRICLFPSYNFFKFFQSLKEKVGLGKQNNYPPGFNRDISDYELLRVDFEKDTEWIHENIIHVLDIDLQIRQFGSPCSFLQVFWKLTKSLNEIQLDCESFENAGNGAKVMMKMFEHLSIANGSKQNIFKKLFDDSEDVIKILDVLKSDLKVWPRFLQCVSQNLDENDIPAVLLIEFK